jgi:hypothetical protein
MSRWLNALWIVCLATVLFVGCNNAADDGTADDASEAAAAEVTSTTL